MEVLRTSTAFLLSTLQNSTASLRRVASFLSRSADVVSFTRQSTPSTPPQTPQSQPPAETEAPLLSVKPIYIPPRFPIVLCHGLYGFDKIGPESLPYLQVHYWGGIKEALEKLGAKVIVTRVPATGDVYERARILNKQLEEILPGENVNFVAHSMGGLDCRYLTYAQSQMPMQKYKVQSLTTISTPHRGSPFMDWCRDTVGLGWVEALEGFPEATRRKLTDSQKRIATGIAQAHPLVARLVSGVDCPAYACLTTDFCRDVFNPQVPNVPGVGYYSYGAAIDPPLYDRFRFSWEIVRAREGPNDGMVSVSSAKWGKYWETINADHFDLKNRCRTKVVRSEDGRHVTLTPARRSSRWDFDSTELYLRLATRLYQDGY